MPYSMINYVDFVHIDVVFSDDLLLNQLEEIAV